MFKFFTRLFGAGVKTQPLVSVIVPTRNRPEMLKEAVASILGQTHRCFEVVVINDGGADVSEALASLGQPEKIICLRHEKTQDRSSARNTGLAAARGKYIAYLDDDDVFYPDHLEKLVGLLERTGAKVAYSDANRALQKQVNGRYVVTKRSPFRARDFDARQLLISNYIPNLCIMHEKACLEATGVFDISLATHEDWDLWIRLSRSFHFAHLKRITCEFRFRDDQSNTTSLQRADFLRTAELIYKRYEGFVEGNKKILEGREKFLGALKKELAASSQK